MEGYLYKWVNYMYGWKRRYFVLHSGVLRYCADQGSHTKAAVHLNLAQVIPHPSKPLRFKIDTGVTMLHLKASSVEEAAQWIEALTHTKNELSEEKDFRENRTSDAVVRSLNQRSLLIQQVSELSVFEAELEELIEDMRLPSDSETQALLQVARNLRMQAANLLSLFEEEDKNTAKIQLGLERASLSPSPKKQSPFKYYAEYDSESLIFHDAMSYVEGFEDSFEVEHQLTRRSLPILRNPRHKPELWQAVEEVKTMELVAFDVPISCYEPLSALQRLAEDLTYTSLLRMASKQTEAAGKLAYVAMFAASTYSFSHKRSMKPFAPIVGETFELEHDGFRCLIEQVSGNEAALHCTHEDFAYSGSFGPLISCHQGEITIDPVGTWKVKLGDSVYTWTKPKTRVLGLNSKDLRVSNVGKVLVTDHKSGLTAHLDFESRLQGDTISGAVTDASLAEIYKLQETQSRGLEALNTRGEAVAKWKPLDWPAVHDYCYYFSDFSLQLNLPPTLYTNLPSTDSRRRPDVRALENGNLTLAETERKRLVLKHNGTSTAASQPKPRWFKKTNSEWTFGGYWEAKESGQFERLPDIFVS